MRGSGVAFSTAFALQSMAGSGKSRLAGGESAGKGGKDRRRRNRSRRDWALSQVSETLFRWLVGRVDFNPIVSSIFRKGTRFSRTCSNCSIGRMVAPIECIRRADGAARQMTGAEWAGRREVG